MLQMLTLITLLFSFIPGPAVHGPADPKTITIAEARSLPLGTIVTIDGAVTVPSGAFSSSTFDQGFAIQDRTGGIEVLAREVFLPGREGAVQPEMTAAVRARGFLPYPIAPDLDTVMSELAAGRPVLVLQKLGAGPWPSWHYAVAVGYDASDGRIVLRGEKNRAIGSQGLFEGPD